MAVEIVGRWKNTRADARFRHRHLLRNRKETKEKVTTGLSMGQFKVSFELSIASERNGIVNNPSLLLNHRYHNWWAYRYYVCELLALLNVIGKFSIFTPFTRRAPNTKSTRWVLTYSLKWNMFICVWGVHKRVHLLEHHNAVTAIWFSRKNDNRIVTTGTLCYRICGCISCKHSENPFFNQNKKWCEPCGFGSFFTDRWEKSVFFVEIFTALSML